MALKYDVVVSKEPRLKERCCLWARTVTCNDNVSNPFTYEKLILY